APPQVPEHSIRVGHGHVGDLPLGLVRESFFLTGQDTEDIIGDPGVLVSVSHVRRVCFPVSDRVTTPVDPPPRAWGLRWRGRCRQEGAALLDAQSTSPWPSPPAGKWNSSWRGSRMRPRASVVPGSL